MKIFLADDDQVICKGLSKVITSFGNEFEVVGAASNGEDALEFLLHHQCDVLITDIKMPVMDGVELIAAIREQGLSLKIIVLSGFDDYYYIRTTLKGAGLLTQLKPIDREELRQLLQVLHDELSACGEAVSSDMRGVIKKAQRFIEEHYHEHLSLSVVAQHIGLSECYFSNLFKLEMGQNFYDYLSERRIETAKRLLQRNPSDKIYEIAMKVGYEETITFNRNFRKYVGMTPKEYRERG